MNLEFEPMLARDPSVALEPHLPLPYYYRTDAVRSLDHTSRASRVRENVNQARQEDSFPGSEAMLKEWCSSF